MKCANNDMKHEMVQAWTNSGIGLIFMYYIIFISMSESTVSSKVACTP